EVPLFGKMAKTAPAIAVFAIKFNVPIVMARSIRQPDGHFVMEVSEPLAMPPKGNSEQRILSLMTHINQQLEKWIRENPEQWLWIHRRFDKSEYR
ncbi:MAG: lysophospholipid acyltransferase family protein, partial [Pseudomonadota bacterium]|nr:lysophospholipid acyltransferase family protein [Pseudomonadota bacterium]